MSATARIRFFGSFWTVSIMSPAQKSARSRPMRCAMMRVATRRRFSIKASRSMIGTAHSSPRVSVVTL